MRRQTLTDGSGRYFDRDRSQKFDEATWFNGSNHVSRATGTQFDHEGLYRTADGVWVLHAWSQWQGSAESWIEIDDGAAARWLSINEHEPHPACAQEYANMEIG